MSSITPNASAASPGAASHAGTGGNAWSAASIDASARWPLLVFFAKGTGWLVLGCVLLLVASIKLHGPFLSDTAWLGLGRVKPAALTALVFGFAAQFGFGISLWMLARLGRAPLLNAPLLFLAGAIWNVGVFLGFLGILGGATTGFAYLEMPRVAWPFVFVSLGLIVLWALLTFHYRRERTLYVSQWFLVTALFWFPWVLSVAVYLLVFQPVRGVMQAVVNAWYAHNLLHLWFTPLGLATLYYFIPKLAGRPLYSRPVALFAFWILAFLAPWGGLARLNGGPLPSWMISASIAANVILVLPVLCAVANLSLTMEGSWAWFNRARKDPVFRFLLFSTGAYLVSGLLTSLTSLRSVAQLTHLTYIPLVMDHLLLLGFFGMAGFGAVYFILPKVTGLAWPSARLARWHWLGSAWGLGIYTAALLLGGLIHGARMNNPAIEFMAAIKSTLPWVGMSTLGLLIFLAGQVAFLVNVQKIAWQLMRSACSAVMASFQGEEPAANTAKEEVVS